MGVLNVTPDSFSDGGRYVNVDAALAHGRRMAAEGAHLVDVGGESTRPGASRVDADTEIKRVVPVIADLAAEGIALSVDTSRAQVAEARARPARAGSTTCPAVSPTRKWPRWSPTRDALGC